MADDEPRPLFDPRMFAPTEFLSEDMDHNIDVTGATDVDVTHTLDHDLPVRRIETGAIAFVLLVAVFGTFLPASTTVHLSVAAAVVLLGNVLGRRLGI